MKKQLNSTSALEPRLVFSEDSFKITHWLGLYEGYLFLNQPKSYERYARVLSRFYAHFPDKSRTYEYLRCDFETYKTDRLKEGASAKTVQIELSVLRGFWRWMIAMDSPGVLINPVVGVRVKKDSKKHTMVTALVPHQTEQLSLPQRHASVPVP